MTSNLKTKIISPESAVMRNLCGMVEYKALKLKVKIDLAFFITLILFGLVTIGNESGTTENWNKRTRIKEAFVMKNLYRIKNQIENLRYCLRVTLCCRFLKLQKIWHQWVSYAFWNQDIIGSDLSISVMW